MPGEAAAATAITSPMSSVVKAGQSQTLHAGLEGGGARRYTWMLDGPAGRSGTRASWNAPARSVEVHRVLVGVQYRSAGGAADTGPATGSSKPPPDTQPPADKHPPSDTHPPADKHPPSETQPPADKHPPSEAQPPADKHPPSETQPPADKHPPSESQPPADKHPPSE